MIVIDYTIIIQIASFLALWFLLTKILFNPLLGLLKERERRTEGVKAETVSLRDEGERLRVAYENGITTARDEGYAVKEVILSEARREREQLLSETNEQAARLLETVREAIQIGMRREREVAVREAEGIARQMAEKILRRGIG
ncbi:MAG: ATP synthase F0 subunit B [Candidatus Binatia bacterium]